MNVELKAANPVFLAVLNGSFFFAADLLKKLNFEYEISFVKIGSYSGLQSGPDLKTLVGLDENLTGRNVVIIEDIIDTGRTMNEIVRQLKEIHVFDIKIATLVIKPGSLAFAVKPDYTGFETPDDFLIGYGLDFNKQGRHFRDIYKIKI
jgi:hypoxanthine phosphoribosyltransferase